MCKCMKFTHVWTAHVHNCLHTCIKCTLNYTNVWSAHVHNRHVHSSCTCAVHTCYVYGMATVSRLLKNIRLFCRISSLLLGSFAKETYHFKEPNNRSHPMTPYYTLRVHHMWTPHNCRQLCTYMYIRHVYTYTTYVLYIHICAYTTYMYIQHTCCIYIYTQHTCCAYIYRKSNSGIAVVITTKLQTGT